MLGFDTPRSCDHGWRPKVTLFLSQPDRDRYQNQISAVMAEELPLEICGYSTQYDSPFSNEAKLLPVERGPVNHWVAITAVQVFFYGYLGGNPECRLEPIEWLTIPQQHLRTIASGNIFHDDQGVLTKLCGYLRWYPHDLWLYLLANQWRRIVQEEPFMDRCGDVGDDLGSRRVATRMV